jgi:hypothetical protein
MKITCTIQCGYTSKKHAEQILHSIKVDDLDFVTSFVKRNILTASIQSTSVSSLIHTLDDYLACVSVAEKIVDKN